MAPAAKQRACALLQALLPSIPAWRMVAPRKNPAPRFGEGKAAVPSEFANPRERPELRREQAACDPRGIREPPGPRLRLRLQGWPGRSAPLQQEPIAFDRVQAAEREPPLVLPRPAFSEGHAGCTASWAGRPPGMEPPPPLGSRDRPAARSGCKSAQKRCLAAPGTRSDCDTGEEPPREA